MNIEMLAVVDRLNPIAMTPVPLGQSYLILLITVLTIVLVVGTTVVWMIVSMKKPTSLSPNAQIELKLAEKEPADGLMPMTLENMGVGSLYVHDKAELSTSDVAFGQSGQAGSGLNGFFVIA